MADDTPPHRTDWTAVNAARRADRMESELPLHPDRPLDVPHVLQEATTVGPAADGRGRGGPPELVAQPDGIVAQFRKNQLARRAAVEHLEVWYDRQLEVVRHRLGEVARVRKAESTLLAEQFLEGINSQHLHYLVELGLRTNAARDRAVLALQDQTAATLREIQQRDWPPALVEQAITGVLERNRRFFAKLNTELGS